MVNQGSISSRTRFSLNCVVSLDDTQVHSQTNCPRFFRIQHKLSLKHEWFLGLTLNYWPKSKSHFSQHIIIPKAYITIVRVKNINWRSSRRIYLLTFCDRYESWNSGCLLPPMVKIMKIQWQNLKLVYFRRLGGIIAPPPDVDDSGWAPVELAWNAPLAIYHKK